MIAKAKAIAVLTFLGLAIAGLGACGGGGGGNDRGSKTGPTISDNGVIIQPPENQPPENGKAANRPPIVLGEVAVNITIPVGQVYSTTAEAHFEDPDNDDLEYSVTSNNLSVASPLLTDDFFLTGKDVFQIFSVQHRIGTAVVTWTARDPEGLTAEKVFYVTVTSEGIDPDERRPTDGSGTVRFEISDGCNDGYGVEYRFFQYPYSGAAPTGVWPREYTEYYNKTYLSSLSCTAGHLVCFGGRTGNARSWGVGFEGDQSCVGKKACCLTCPSGNATSSMSKQLTCK